MMDDIFYYMSVLLPRYKCLTIPGLGAFILNKEEVPLIGDAENLMPDNYAISFNGELQHDDGMLTSYIQSIKGISYENASKELTTIAKEIKKALLYEGSVSCTTLGRLSLVDGQMLFVQNKDYVFPSHYGLTPVSLPTIESIKRASERTSKRATLKKNLVVASAVAAVFVLMLIPSNVIRDPQINVNNQQAGYLSSLTETKVVEEASSLPLIEEVVAEENKAEEVVVPKKSLRTYYMIVGGASSMQATERIIKMFEEDGLQGLQVVESDDRFRIYVKSYEDKAEAEQAVIQFRKDNPKYETAWIFSKRN